MWRDWIGLLAEAENLPALGLVYVLEVYEIPNHAQAARRVGLRGDFVSSWRRGWWS